MLHLKLKNTSFTIDHDDLLLLNIIVNFEHNVTE